MNKLNTVSFLFILIFILNCYATERPYIYSREFSKTQANISETNPQFESGKPNWLIDNLGHYFFSLLSKLILWNWKMNNHKISNETKEYLNNYILENNLYNVKVRYNQYAPISEFKRLIANKDIHWLVRYTIGIISWLRYTLLPDRLFAGLIGGDHYNSYTNTINVFSDLIPVVIHEGGHAKDYATRQRKTLYSLSYAIPLVPLYQEAIASEDAMDYFYEKDDKENQLKAYKLLSPAYGTYIGGELVPISIGAIIMAIPGHIYGRIKAHKLKKKFALKIKSDESKKE